MARKLLFLAMILLLGLFSTGATKPKPTFNVRNFGATGNGVTKDTAAFQKALDTCAVSGGGEVLVPAGKYLIGSIQMGSRTYAIYIKTRTGRAGVIENITGEDLDVANGGFLSINATSDGNQSTPDDTVEGVLGYPVIRNIRFSNVRLKDVTTLVEAIKVSPDNPILGLSLSNIAGTCKKGMSLANIRDMVLRGITATGFSGPLLAIDNTTGSGLKEAVTLKAK